MYHLFVRNLLYAYYTHRTTPASYRIERGKVLDQHVERGRLPGATIEVLNASL